MIISRKCLRTLDGYSMIRWSVFRQDARNTAVDPDSDASFTKVHFHPFRLKQATYSYC